MSEQNLPFRLLDKNQLKELLELASIAEQKMRESSEGLTALAEKWQDKAKDRPQKSGHRG
ncbi:hypothetical protein H6G17_27420 [Chroococcidiopsis sp. FACHB-1243]|uniref:hypothetical protein n=1 Tax=Chroococcidiopsis sp. [FACHB-1243] TaxID=2692781 RepID=UPI00177A8423|nr:hypothetical protein [Chroococcidiopsis sp. [FACHB-1243]]MBD2309193.1 hypothetical protein [Chroococcidiopsis sp. [FACHB-1243]]